MTTPDEAFALLRDRFLMRCRDQLAALKAIADGGGPLSSSTDSSDLLKIAHSLAGAGGTFGFPDISARASDLETLLIADHDADAGAVWHALQALILEIEHEVA
ncbi:Hpt domain-containing protein [Mesorhizobium sp. SP-1A]|uniref:Hpt domain-containing protein n=1 Tax=Mesorhizobium sp. SP-1A TaxID=3077840 RepID=UPI0028F701AE|nr:Hpt domain-containing protein [Mesorhizobium sp. SP-1A]